MSSTLSYHLLGLVLDSHRYLEIHHLWSRSCYRYDDNGDSGDDDQDDDDDDDDGNE